ncbi:hypothetical protein PHJA_000723100 [Phtheirospermum japonicum]|uniref:DUF668 domain-containing protein n=1 Tax=Phtheirospermum japonicum TaxID=374723 RepID=A0A830BMG9_9LAMI|nr:hypothetical protein PHJA_000723100 [Phtheirospermum japonicum]
MVSETWILKMSNQVSSNLKQALYLDNSTKSSNKKQSPKERQIIGILSFEVANVMSKIMNLHKSLTDNEVLKLKNEILKCEGIKTLVFSDEKQLLELALVEKLDDLNRIAVVVSRLGKKCTIPALQGFEHVYGDIISGATHVKELGFLVKDMESMVRKMERYVNHTTSLYREMEVMNELESATKKFQQNHHEESKKVFEQKLIWQKQDVNHLKDVSLWNRTYDKVVELLARTVCTVYARIHIMFGDGHISKVQQKTSLSKSVSNRTNSFRPKMGLQKSEGGLFGPEDFNFACGVGPGRLFMECISLSSSASKVEDGDDDDYDDRGSIANSLKSDNVTVFGSFVRPINGPRFQPKSGLLVFAPPKTVGGSALALHYANVIIVVEKLLRYPHLVGDEARADLYQMLPTSLRKTLKAKLKSYIKDLAIFDAHLAHDWKEKLDSRFVWLGPLAHNMIKWQGERNVEQHQIVARTNVLLLQTLYFADREKTEEIICEVLVGLNYICRYEQQQNALLDCASSFDFEDCVEWQSRNGGSFRS